MKDQLKLVPSSPGIYKFFSNNKIIYIGKAKNLKKRVSSYFGKSFKDRKSHQIKVLTDRVETFSTTSEAEALILEQSLIKENLPRFNILLRDDKTYPYIHFLMDHKYPSISLKRSKNAVSKNFFGPFISAKAVKSTIKDLQKIYQIRNCSNSTFNNRSRPCIEHQMDRCSAPCVGFISEVNYNSDVLSSQNYLSSTGKKARSLMMEQMQKFAKKQEFESANEVKKRIARLDVLQQEQSFKSSLSNADIFSCVSKLDKTGVCILSIRDGRIRGVKTHFLNGNHLSDKDNLFQSLIFSYYQNTYSLPKKILLIAKSINLSLIKDAVKLKFKKNISISTNINQDLRGIVKLAKLNANQAIDNKVNQTDKYIYAIKDLSNLLGMRKNELTIEGYDVSHHGGKDAVASLVRFSSIGPEKSKYRTYNIPQNLAGNDAESIRYCLEKRVQSSASNPLPDIILIDGGKIQLNIALKTINHAVNNPPIILSIVKGAKRIRLTETILSKDGILEMSKNSPGYNFLQQVRDESHRFAIKSNRIKKLKKIKLSQVELIKGVGPVTRRRLLKKFKTVSSLKQATINDLEKIRGISGKIAKDIYENLKIL